MTKDKILLLGFASTRLLYNCLNGKQALVENKKYLKDIKDSVSDSAYGCMSQEKNLSQSAYQNWADFNSSISFERNRIVFIIEKIDPSNIKTENVQDICKEIDKIWHKISNDKFIGEKNNYRTQQQEKDWIKKDPEWFREIDSISISHFRPNLVPDNSHWTATL